MRIAREVLTFDDVLLQPDYSDVLPREVDLSTTLTPEITLNIPLLSAAMDTVTEARLAIALAQEGGIGIIHKNMQPEQQAREVRKVKKYESGIVRDPITVSPDMTIREVIDLTRAMNISGVPVVVEISPSTQRRAIPCSRSARAWRFSSDTLMAVCWGLSVNRSGISAVYRSIALRLFRN